ncbi:MAG: asparagine synthase-related protein [bacterium]|nr:asparagine synthase-related protein [bacterium]
MAGIAGIACSGKQREVNRMLDKIKHRGPAGQEVIELDHATLGIVWTETQSEAGTILKQQRLARDDHGLGHLAQVQAIEDKIILLRSPLGVAPLYYGWTTEGYLCFASEVKLLLPFTQEIYELPPGNRYDGNRMEPFFHLEKPPPLDEPPDKIAAEVYQRLAGSVEKCISDSYMGSWLSGGLDSSALAALARPLAKKFYTFSVGLPGAPDLEYARVVADFIQSEHLESIVSFEEILAVLPKVIYHLESFDALLVRSSILNYLVAQLASDYVPTVFSGEGGDELFAGYEYLKSIPQNKLADELIDIANRLHNTALQRVDRCSSAQGTVAYLCFLAPEVVDYALRIPIEYKLHNGVEKWILRRAMDGKLPDRVLNRPKAKFWEGAGVGEILARYADKKITDDDFKRERILPNRWLLNTKEELMYYRIFREHFGELSNLFWMGRTKGAPTRTCFQNTNLATKALKHI